MRLHSEKLATATGQAAMPVLTRLLLSDQLDPRGQIAAPTLTHLLSTWPAR